MGDPSTTILSPYDDYLLGQAFMRNLRMNVEIIEDPELNAYINSLGYRLLSAAGSNLEFNFFIVNDPSINAFAGPGGHIGIHTGLILAAETEGEVASVMAHEIAHVTQRHLARAFQKASVSQLQTAAAILAAILIGSPELSAAMITAATAGNIQHQLNFTRAHEKEADRVGIDILASSGFDPYHMPGFFSRLQEAYRYVDNSNVPELLRTHPVTPNRIADSQNRASQYPKVRDHVSPNFPYIQAKLRSLDESKHAYRMKNVEALLAQSKPLSSVDQYEYALINIQNGNFGIAGKYSQALLAESPESIQFIALQAQVEIMKGDSSTAIKRLQKALLIFPNHPKLSVLYATALLESGKASQAADTMRELIQQQQRFVLPSYYQILARAEFAAGREGHAYIALADHYYMIGLTRTAINHLETALKVSENDSDFQVERIKAQLNMLKQVALAERDSRQ